MSGKPFCPRLELKVISSLEKVFPDSDVFSIREYTSFSALKGEVLSFQIAFRTFPFHTVPCTGAAFIRAAVESDLTPFVRLRQVRQIPSGLPAYPDHDENYLRTAPGLYPDLLEPCDGLLSVSPNYWQSLWVDIEVPVDYTPGVHPILIAFSDMEGKTIRKVSVSLTIIDAVLPEQTVIHTEWVSYDCIADYYRVKPLSEAWWSITEKFMRTAVKRGINMILTPVFTPPLDTAAGTERTPVQLAGIEYDSGIYRFDFSNLKRFVDLCLSCGVQYFEIAHLFSQWGAKCAPNIYVLQDGETVHRFGWHTPACGDDYREFLDAFLPALTQKLAEWGIDKNTVFHISDEPSPESLENYKAAKALVSGHLAGYPIIDALSHVEYYEQGICTRPVPANDSVHDFIDAGVPDLWTYYCCGQGRDVSNLFFSMPSARNRILGVQMYLYHIAGFLHWGYNFYSSSLSLHKINPFLITDGEGAFPSGDPFLVYPGPDGTPMESIRIMVMNEAFQDVRAFRLLESLTDFETVCGIIEEGIEPITFYSYPKSPSYLISLRERVNRKIQEIVGR